MILDDKPTSAITVEEIQALVEDGAPEDAFLDYKAKPYRHDADGIHELVKDVSAFANASGGYLLIGIGPDSNDPRHPGGLVNVENPERERRRMIDHCLEKIEPRLPWLDIRTISVDGKNLLICRVPDGDRKPYCAKPDREHHYFWKRYEDGNRLMSVPEIRDCLEGERVYRELAEMRHSFARLHDEQVKTREAAQDVDECNAFELQSVERFRRFVDDEFQRSVGGEPYYRLSATPLPLNQLNLRDRAQAISGLIDQPPRLRTRGWDLCIFPRLVLPRTIGIGIARDDVAYRHLRVLWNGHAEFWTEVDDGSFRTGDHRDAEHRFLYPYALSEPVANFILFMRELCQIANFDGDLQFSLTFYRVRGFYLAPGQPNCIGYSHARSDAGHPHGPKPFDEDNLLVQVVTSRVTDLPGQVIWQLVSQVYYRFHYRDDQIPFFDQDHNFTLGDDSDTE